MSLIKFMLSCFQTKNKVIEPRSRSLPTQLNPTAPRPAAKLTQVNVAPELSSESDMVSEHPEPSTVPEEIVSTEDKLSESINVNVLSDVPEETSNDVIDNDDEESKLGVVKDASIDHDIDVGIATSAEKNSIIIEEPINKEEVEDTTVPKKADGESILGVANKDSSLEPSPVTSVDSLSSKTSKKSTGEKGVSKSKSGESSPNADEEEGVESAVVGNGPPKPEMALPRHIVEKKAFVKKPTAATLKNTMVKNDRFFCCGAY